MSKNNLFLSFNLTLPKQSMTNFFQFHICWKRFWKLLYILYRGIMTKKLCNHWTLKVHELGLWHNEQVSFTFHISCQAKDKTEPSRKLLPIFTEKVHFPLSTTHLRHHIDSLDKIHTHTLVHMQHTHTLKEHILKCSNAHKLTLTKGTQTHKYTTQTNLKLQFYNMSLMLFCKLH